MKKFFATALLFVASFGAPTAFAEGAEASGPIDLPSVSVLPQGGTAKIQDGVLALSSDNGESVFAFQFRTPSVFDKIVLENSAGIADGPAVFFFQAKDAPQVSQMPVSVRNSQILLAGPVDSSSFAFFGLGFQSQAVAFSDVRAAKSGFVDKFSTVFEPELLKPSTINLLYGHKFGNVPVVKILGLFALLVAGLLAVFRFKKAALAVLLVCWFSYDLLLMRDQFLVMRKTDETFLSPANAEDRTYFDFGNLYAFVDETKKCLDGKEGGVNFYAPSEWPFWHNVSYHLIPRRATYSTTDKPYYAAFAGGEVKDGKFIYRGKTVDENVTLLCSLKGGSVILQKNNR